MAYSQYKDSGRSLGKVLYQLSRIGIPLRIVEEVQAGETITLYGKPFASIKWSQYDTPMFKFVGQSAESYNEIQLEYYVREVEYQLQSNAVGL